MAREIFTGKYFSVSHTLEPEGPHRTIPGDHYEDACIITGILSGRGTYFINGHRCDFSEGEMITVGPEEIHSFHVEQPGSPHERISIYCSPATLSPYWEYALPLLQIFTGHEAGCCNSYPLEKADRAQMLSLLRECAGLCDRLVREASPTEEARMHVLILHLLFLLHDQFQRRAALSPADPERDPVTTTICQYIHYHPTADLSYRALQERFLISHYQLAVVFPQNTGFTLTEYVLQSRLKHAAYLMRSGRSVSDAAEASGFRNYSYFYKAFMKHMGISPSEYCKKQLPEKFETGKVE